MTSITNAGPAPLSVADVTLVVRDLPRMSAFYQRSIGLQPLLADRSEHVLGAGGEPLLRLRADPRAAPADRRATGLFHTAFLLPSRADLATWLRDKHSDPAIRLSGASDHAVSEALYLSDPEGNGIEIYADRPRDRWTGSRGQVTMTTAPLDIEDLLTTARRDPWRRAPEATRVGHVHLQVGEIAAAESFYRDTLGLAVTHRRPGGTFFASGGYHHHIAANIWNSAGATARRPSMTGLIEIRLVATPDGGFVPARYRDPAGIDIDVVAPVVAP